MGLILGMWSSPYAWHWWGCMPNTVFGFGALAASKTLRCWSMSRCQEIFSYLCESVILWQTHKELPPFYSNLFYFWWALMSFMSWEGPNILHTLVRSIPNSSTILINACMCVWKKYSIPVPTRGQWISFLLSGRWSHIIISGVMNSSLPNSLS